MTQLRDRSIDTIEEGGRRRARTRSEWRDGSIDTVGRRRTRVKREEKIRYNTIERRTLISESVEAAATSNRTVPDPTRNPRTDEDRNSNSTVPYLTWPTTTTSMTTSAAAGTYNFDRNSSSSSSITLRIRTYPVRNNNSSSSAAPEQINGVQRLNHHRRYRLHRFDTSFWIHPNTKPVISPLLGTLQVWNLHSHKLHWMRILPIFNSSLLDWVIIPIFLSAFHHGCN